MLVATGVNHADADGPSPGAVLGPADQPRPGPASRRDRPGGEPERIPGKYQPLAGARIENPADRRATHRLLAVLPRHDVAEGGRPFVARPQLPDRPRLSHAP